MNTIKLQKNIESTQLEYNKWKLDLEKTHDDNTIHQLDHNETVLKSKYDNNGYWLWEYYLEYLKRQLVTKDCMTFSFNFVI